MVCFVDCTFKQTGTYGGLVLLADGTGASQTDVVVKDFV